MDGPVEVVEYVGEPLEELRPHGNSKDQQGRPFMHTPAQTLQAISSGVTSQQCKSVYDNLVAEIDLLDALRDSRVVRNKKYNDGVKLRKNDTDLQNNFADEIQAVCSMVVHDDFVQSVTLSHARVPCVVLYKARQIGVESLLFQQVAVCGRLIKRTI